MRKCSFKNPIRIFKGTEIIVDRKGKLVLGKGIAFGMRCVCSVREDARIVLKDQVFINSDCKIVAHERIEIGKGTIIGPNVLIYDHDHLFDVETGVKRKEYVTSEVVIGENCWVGANTVILRGTHIGNNCIIGAGSVVKGNYSDGTKIIQKRTLDIKMGVPE